jgi:hypothetical protein
MFSRRDFLCTTAGLTSAGWLLAQDAQRPVFWVKLSVTVTERLVWRDVLTFSSQTRYINGLEPGDFRVLEDGILQKIATFAEGAKPPLLVSDDGSTRPLVDPKASEAGKPGLDLTIQRLLQDQHLQAVDASEAMRKDLDNSYIITYFPDSSNHNEGFRKINIEIAPDVAKHWRVRCSPGYRPSDFRAVRAAHFGGCSLV